MFDLTNNSQALEMYRKMFPHFTPNIFQQELIESYVTDMEVWKEVIEMWEGNAYRPQSIKKMIDCYEEKIAKQKSTSHVRNQPTQREAIEAELKAIEAMGIQ